MHSIATNRYLPMLIAVHGDILNVGTYPDPSSSPNERSGPRVQKRTSDYSDGSHASCVHSIKTHQITVMALIMLVACIASEAIPLCPHINDSTPSQVVLLMLLLLNKSTVKYSFASHPHSILQHQSLSVSGCGGIQRAWRHCVNLYGNSLEPMKLQST